MEETRFSNALLERLIVNELFLSFKRLISRQCIEELKFKSKRSLEQKFVETHNVIFKSDTMVPEHTREALLKAVKSLEDIPEREKDWHPGSDEQVLDLVHPSLYPLVFGQTRILPASTVGLSDCCEKYGEGEVLAVPSYDRKQDKDFDRINYRVPIFHARSVRFQWLPSDFEIPKGSDEVKLLSYINGLHPEKNGDLHKIIEQIVGKAILLWDAMFASLIDVKKARIFPKDTCYGGIPEGEDQLSRSNYSELPVVHPEPPNFEESEWLQHQRILERNVPVNLRNSFGRLQIVVKLANIHLTPEKPNYPGGSWHVEGTLNESICATALYYYESDNIAEPRLSFRTQFDGEETAKVPYPQDEWRAISEVYGIEGNSEPCTQELGSVRTKQGRLLVFPNVYQHRVEPFGLASRKKAGHRKILALFLIDPYRPIISTANIPCQQKSWWAEKVRGIGPLANLPPELNQKILDMVPYPVSLEKAKKQREELMAERRIFCANTKPPYRNIFIQTTATAGIINKPISLP
ncbi:MAG: hypothetical protein Q9195_000614 [Heterodermia aff. obscurata]